MADGPAPGIGVALLGYGAIADMHVAALARAGADCSSWPVPKPDQVADVRDAGTASRPSSTDTGARDRRRRRRGGRHRLAEPGPRRTGSTLRSRQAGTSSSRSRSRSPCPRPRRSCSRPRVAGRIADGLPHAALLAPVPARRTRRCGPAAGGRRTSSPAACRAGTRTWAGRADERSWTDDLLWHHGGHVVDAVLRLARAPVSRGAARPSGRSGSAAGCRWTTRSRCAPSTAASPRSRCRTTRGSAHPTT